MMNDRQSTNQPAPDRSDMRRVYEVARLYYTEHATQAEIARHLAVSRPTVSRLLAEAREKGVVRISVHHPSEHETEELAEQLRQALGLRAVLLAPGDQGRHIAAALTPLVHTVLGDMDLEPNDALLVSSGRTIYEISHQPLPRLTGVVIAPTVGGQSEPEAWYQTNEITQATAQNTGGSPRFLFAQALPSPGVARALRADPGYQQIRALWDRARGAIVGIGAPPASRRSISLSVPAADRTLLAAVGDVCLNFYDKQGRLLEFPGSDRMIRLPHTRLRAIPHVLGVAVGAEKAWSIIGGARAAVFNRLVSDEITARAVLRALER